MNWISRVIKKCVACRWIATALLAVSFIDCSVARSEPASTAPTAGTFCNPIVRSVDAADPWVILHDGLYYFTGTLDPEGGLWIWSSKNLSQLDSGKKVKVWSAPATGGESHAIWAPELHWINGKWYLYFTASDGKNQNHRQYVLEAKTSDPQGDYIDRGRIDPDLDSFAIDGSVLEMPNGKLYWLYSDGKLHIAPMLSPVKVDDAGRSLLASATLPWERGWLEAPEALIHNGRIFIAYSAGHSGTPNYSIGLLSYNGGDILDAKSWTKSPMAVFYPYFGADGAAYTVGHNSFTTSPDGREDWIVYHAKDWRGEEDEGFAGRTTRIQKFTWSKDNYPIFGHPIPSGIPLRRPSGESDKTP
ncbi:MAG TPA: glycoside hydrolase family 43 protein [Tepidisphaeraceae bacterium]